MSEANWYYIQHGRQQGPITLEALRELVQQGSLTGADQIWGPSLNDWTPVQAAPPHILTDGVAAGVGPAFDAGAAGTPWSPPREEINPFRSPSEASWQQYGGAASGPVRYAGFWMRLVALIVDALVINVPLVVGTMIMIIVLGVDPETLDQPGVGLPIRLGEAAINWLYFAGLESSQMQGTLGKRLLGLKVTDYRGQRLSFLHATGRHFAKIISGCTLGIGYLIAAFTEKKQALHDMVANTYVVRG